MPPACNGGILWANLHLLFWLSLFPFVTGWMGENHWAPHTVALYGFVALMAAIAYFILVLQLIRGEGQHSELAKAFGRDLKGKISPLIYVTGIVFAFILPAIPCLLRHRRGDLVHSGLSH